MGPSHLPLFLQSTLFSHSLLFLNLWSLLSPLSLSRDSYLFTEKIELPQLSLRRHKLPVSAFAPTIIEQVTLLKSKASSSTCTFDPIISDLLRNLTLPVFSSLLTAALGFCDPELSVVFCPLLLTAPSQCVYSDMRCWPSSNFNSELPFFFKLYFLFN